MPLAVDGILYDTLSADPGSPQEGQAWYNSTSQLFKVYRNSATVSLTDSTTFSGHTGNTSNPHTTTLEQARTAGSTLAGAINMGGFAITNIAQGSSSTDVAQRQWVTDQINQKLRGFDWQNSVLSRITTPPGSPTTGDRYLIIATATSTWLGKENQIAEWNGSSWDYAIPNEGFTTRVEAENLIYTYDGASWGSLGTAVSHSSLTNLTADDHTQYLLVAGTRAMSGSLNMGGNAITNVGTVDGVTVSAHASRHNPGGADALAVASAVGLDATSTNTQGAASSYAISNHTHAIDTATGTISTIQAGASASGGTAAGLVRRDHVHAVSTAAVITLTDSTNAEGTATSLARSDHTHAHGNRGGGTLHSLTSSSGHGFAPQSNFAATANPTVNNDGTQGYVPGSHWNNTTNGTSWICISNGTGAAVWKELTNIAGVLTTKAGKVLAASFAGNPKKATVTFTTAFASTAYAITLTPIIATSGTLYTPNVESQLAGSFVINMGTNTVSSLTAVSWTAIASGESS